MNSPHKGQWCGALTFSLICVWINCWTQSWSWWFETPSIPLWRHCDATAVISCLTSVTSENPVCTCPVRPISQIPQCIGQMHNAPFCNRNVHTRAHFCYKTVHCRISDWYIVGFVQRVYWNNKTFFNGLNPSNICHICACLSSYHRHIINSHGQQCISTLLMSPLWIWTTCLFRYCGILWNIGIYFSFKSKQFNTLCVLL